MVKFVIRPLVVHFRNDDVRVAVTKTFLAYFDCFEGTEGFEPGLYRAHLEDMYKGLLVHLDDPDQCIQDAVFGVYILSGFAL